MCHDRSVVRACSVTASRMPLRDILGPTDPFGWLEMKHAAALALILLVTIGASQDALARRGSGGFHGGFHGRSVSTTVHRHYTVGGFALFSPLWWGSLYDRRPLPAEPIVYIEQPKAPPAVWYYCEQPAGYYPDVKACPGGWLLVMPETKAEIHPEAPSP